MTHAELILSACAIHARQFPTAVEQSRKLINAYQFNNEPLRILLASLGNGLRATDAFLASTLSKHLLREIKLADAALKKPDAIRWNTTLRRYGLGTGKGGDGDDVDEEDEAAREGSVVSAEKTRLPTKANPVNVAVYGQICLAAKSYQSALCRLSHPLRVYHSSPILVYLLHAYDYCSDDPLICLCLAIASFGRAMQRQADNRNHLITQVGFKA